MRGYAALAALLLATACTSGGGPKADPTTGTSLPMIATDPCPGADALLDAPAPDGDRLPAVTLRCLGSDTTVNLRLLGRVPYVVNLWGSWCGPCQEEMPDFQAVYREYKGRVGFLGVDTMDFEGPARSAIQRSAVSYPSVFDKDSKVKAAVATRSMPTTVFVGADGRIKEVHVSQMTAGELRQSIKTILGVP
jgi:thiol-disulfide isomerase/thioredoxin